MNNYPVIYGDYFINHETRIPSFFIPSGSHSTWFFSPLASRLKEKLIFVRFAWRTWKMVVHKLFLGWEGNPKKIGATRVVRWRYMMMKKTFIYIGYIPTPLTVNKMVCFYFYHPGGAPRFSWFSCVFIWWYFWCILMCSCVLFLVRFSRVFCRAFSGVFWWFCWWYFLCFSWCFFHCVLVLFSVLFFVLVPFLFYIRFPLVVVLFFAVLFFVVFGCFFRAFFRAFCGVFFVSFIVLFFVHFFVLFLVFFFEFFFFVPWVAPETNDHNILHFGPCFFRCFFWWSL